MDQEHRETIDLCCDYIIPNINIKKLWPKLLENKVYNIDDVNIPNWEHDITNESIKRDIFLTIKTRGPKAFTRLLTSLRQSDHEELADILEGKRELMNNDMETTTAMNIKQDEFYLSMQNAERPLEIQVRKATKFLDGPEYKKVQKYPIRSKPHGLVLIVTNINYKEHTRSAAEHDELNLKNLFEQMGFQVIPVRNLTSEGLTSTIKDFSQKKELRYVDSCFVIISSHGNKSAEYEVSEIECVPVNDYSDSSGKKNTVLCKDILKYFSAEACPYLAGKPKIFIFQLCRGKEEQTSVKPPRQVTDAAPPCPLNETIHLINEMTVRNQEDMLLAFATLPNFVAFRDNEVGSWFIQILCEVFMNHAHDTHLVDLLHMVDARLEVQRTNSGNCQTMEISWIGFKRHCYLNPGLFEKT